ncbi:hypothetical protein EU534_00445 [Candidatus Heimdallarchaeota archaeon]|nr:MAG: hypothetical protein EU534_00445 [Candidatus Heimdallarchaeota archaeon]
MTAETMELEFDQEAVSKAEKEFEKIQLDPAQQEMVDSITKITSEFISLPETAVKSFTWKVMNNWQKMRRITIAELENRPLRDRNDAAKEIIKQAKKFYLELLSESTLEQREILAKNFDTFIKHNSPVLHH